METRFDWTGALMIITQDETGEIRITTPRIGAEADIRGQYAAYWRSQAHRIMKEHPQRIHTVVVAASKSDVFARGCYTPPPGVYVCIRSTGGKWGRGRRDYCNLAAGPVQQRSHN